MGNVPKDYEGFLVPDPAYEVPASTEVDIKRWLQRPDVQWRFKGGALIGGWPAGQGWLTVVDVVADRRTAAALAETRGVRALGGFFRGARPTWATMPGFACIARRPRDDEPVDAALNPGSPGKGNDISAENVDHVYLGPSEDWEYKDRSTVRCALCREDVTLYYLAIDAHMRKRHPRRRSAVPGMRAPP